jgi:hypothetical protein
VEKIKIKIIARGGDSLSWARQLPKSDPFLDQFKFIWRADVLDYDWLVVIDDLSRSLRAKPERLKCSDEHTLLVTTEPDSITKYGRAFCAQFAHVLTSQPLHSLTHPNRIYSHTGNLWFNDHSFEELEGQPFPGKVNNLSTVCSNKQQKYTLHKNRHDFCHWLKDQLPELEIYGHGTRYIEHKYEALDSFRFHLAIENYVGRHHWTEKLADSFLSGAFPIYYGCTNLEDYFPVESFLQIDIFKPEESLAKIRAVTEDKAFYSSRITALNEARYRVMYQHNLLFMIGKLVEENYNINRLQSGRPMYGRKQIRLKRPSEAVRHLSWNFKRHFKSI